MKFFSIDIENELQYTVVSVITLRACLNSITISLNSDMTDQHRIDSPDSNHPATADSALSLVRRVPIGDILGGGREVVLVHRNAEYRLRLTSNDKLILTK